ncbi:unnamed protein product [Lactuca virosa]|uniref:Uncharacterized protein n=1 Tax=Lactuca virosa TaxID=75947 RepID=A0AAU9NNA9_9ASTR|nr:unnamed protein product [Lactuca virosa]
MGNVEKQKGTTHTAQGTISTPALLQSLYLYLYLTFEFDVFTAHLTMSDCQGKSSWPELVGANGGAAAATIERENPRVDAMVILDGTPTTGDFRCDRVRVWVNSSGVVLRTPRIG